MKKKGNAQKKKFWGQLLKMIDIFKWDVSFCENGQSSMKTNFRCRRREICTMHMNY